MPFDPLLHKAGVLLATLMLIAGIALGAWSLTHLPTALPASTASAFDVPVVAAPRQSPLAAPVPVPTSPLVLPVTVSGLEPPIVISMASTLPLELRAVVDAYAITQTNVITTLVPSASPSTVRLDYNSAGGKVVYRQIFAAAARFDTLDLTMRWNEVKRIWQGRSEEYTSIAVLANTLPALQVVLGPAGTRVAGYSSASEIVDAVRSDTPTLAIVPFDLLEPELAVIAIDGQNPVDNGAKFSQARYPLAVPIYAHTFGSPTPAGGVAGALAALPPGNRDPNRLTVVAMTGVTALTRFTAEQMDERGSDWPAAVVGPELASADITAISNEVPFVKDCETNTDPDNLVFCSKPEYIDTLFASGADIVGLTGNHQNDFGLENSLKSLEVYADAELEIYGGGADVAAALAPLYVVHNGNRLAFLGANGYGPPSAWATDTTPGSAPFDLAVMSASIRNIKEQRLADLVFAELQYLESYDTRPLPDQRQDFSALIRAGADIVTGVQSHVPQALEFLDGRLILYGLGNLYFDQMWSDDARNGLIVKHTVYAGRHISTQLLPTVLYDFGQPRWATARERTAILSNVFAASDLE